MKLTGDNNIKDSLDIIQRFFKAYIKCTWILMSDVSNDALILLFELNVILMNYVNESKA